MLWMNVALCHVWTHAFIFSGFVIIETAKTLTGLMRYLLCNSYSLRFLVVLNIHAGPRGGREALQIREIPQEQAQLSWDPWMKTRTQG